MSAHGDVDLGHTLAGWTGTALATLGCAALGAALCLGSARTAAAGAALLVAAALTTWLLHLAGWGKPSGPRPAAQWDWRVRDATARTGHPDCLGCRIAGRRVPARPAALAAAPPAARRPTAPA
ncbi:HGxxPAAW family protein [Streptomyces sp. NRRL F-5727]|uniref:HGxxPAAW family protein n=1 Tax=Streptomyces sp. NRRL F-5727 TaxID=1463871 RepID=UPI0004C7CA58|nr:HGxxPAAW family protein [Streptomyces sp. NRRL F-5727]